MSDLINHIKGYSASVKTWNKTTFDDSLYAFPKKGFAPYNQVQKLRLGQEITPLKTVKQMEKPEEPIKIVKPKPEAKKEEAKKSEKKTKEKKPEAKKSKKKSKPKAEVAKEKAEVKEKAVKEVIQAIIKEEAPVNQVVATEEIPSMVVKEVDDLDDLKNTVARMEALEKMAETSGYYKSEDGKKIHDEFMELQKKLQKYNDGLQYRALKKKDETLANKIIDKTRGNHIRGIWAVREHDEQMKAKEEAVPEAYRNSLTSYNDQEYWKKTSAKEKKEYLASVYGMKASDQEYITRHMHGHLEKAYKAYVKKVKATAENK